MTAPNCLKCLIFLAGNGEENITRFEAKIVKEACKDKYILFLNNKISAALDCIKERHNTTFESGEITTGIDVHQDFCNKTSALTLGDEKSARCGYIQSLYG